MDFAIAFALLAVAVVLVVIGPLRRPPHAETEADEARRRALEASKEAKYREIRDAELDREMGKLAEDDWRVVDRELRAQAIEILRELEGLAPEDPRGSGPPRPGGSPG